MGSGPASMQVECEVQSEITGWNGLEAGVDLFWCVFLKAVEVCAFGCLEDLS